MTESSEETQNLGDTNTLTDAPPPENGPDFTFLSSKDDYTRYFTLLERVWRALMQSYELRRK